VKFFTISNLFLRGIVLAVVFAALSLPAQDAVSASLKQATQLHYLPADEPKPLELLAPPPLFNSPEQAADLTEVETVYHSASSNDLAVAFSQKKFSIFTFTPVIGVFFQPGKFPKTEQFFSQVQKEAASVTDGAKDYWKRPRPFVTEPSLLSGKPEKSFSYPSGHSTESMVLALVLAEVFPDKREGIIAEARSIGWHRVQIARHYPTDIYAGRVLAQAIVRAMNKNPDFQRDLADAKAEIAGALTAKN
jgi:acid phosphatase (class A)